MLLVSCSQFLVEHTTCRFVATGAYSGNAARAARLGDRCKIWAILLDCADKERGGLASSPYPHVPQHCIWYRIPHLTTLNNIARRSAAEQHNGGEEMDAGRTMSSHRQMMLSFSGADKEAEPGTCNTPSIRSRPGQISLNPNI